MKVRPVDGRRDLRAFIDFPYQLHRGEPLWAPPLKVEQRQRLDRKRNPFFDHGRAAYFLAERDGRAVGRIAAVANGRHDELYGDDVGFFGFFECVDDSSVAAALFDTAATWLSERGYERMRGPVSFSTNDECGLLVRGFDDPPALMMPYNPPYYVRLLEDAGFDKSKDLLAFQGGHPNPVPARSERAVERLRARTGVELRGIRNEEFAAEVDRIKQAYNAAWQENWGFVPMSDREIDAIAAQFRPIHVPDLIPFAEIGRRLVGFGLAIPDLNEVLVHNRSGRLFPVVLRLLWAVRRRKIRRMRILLLGILPEFRGKGVDAMLWQWIYSRGLANGFRRGEAGWILEDNAAMCNAARRMGFEHSKTFRLYDRPVRRSAA